MNVSLYFPIFEDIKNFIQISKRCQETIFALKTNPYLTNEPSLISFQRHFKIDTLNLSDLVISGTKQLLLDANLIKYPNIDLLVENETITGIEIQQIVPKISSLHVAYEEHNDESLQRQCHGATMYIKYATYFNKLKYLYGDAKLIYQFLYKFTLDGTDTNVNFPKKIVLEEFDGYAIEINTSFVNVLNKIKSLIRSLDETSIYVVAHEHCQDAKFMKSFNKIHYCYEVLNDNGCKLMENNLVCNEGCIQVDGLSNFNYLNFIIEQTHASLIQISNGKLTSQTDDWILPSCISKLEISESNFGIENESDNDNSHSNDEGSQNSGDNSYSNDENDREIVYSTDPNYSIPLVMSNIVELTLIVKPFKFIPFSDGFVINDNLISISEWFKETSVDYLYSPHFYTFDEEEDEKLIQIQTQNGLIELPDLIHYIEITTIGVCQISFGVFDSFNSQFSTDRHVGWDNNSIGYHSDDGYLFEGSYNGKKYGKAYGIKNETNVIGCGFIKKLHTVFFTCNGKKLRNSKMRFSDGYVALAIAKMNKIEVNYGETPFKFNLVGAIKKLQ
ncbi:B30.2/SPRY domain-containing protein [Entamoeba marina]